MPSAIDFSNVGSGPQTATIWAPSMIARVTNGAAYTSTELATNDIILPAFAFDPGTDEGVGVWVDFGPRWDAGTIRANFFWTTNTAGTGDCVWACAGRSYGNDDALDQAVGTAVSVTSTLTTTTDMNVSGWTGDITLTNAATEEQVYLEFTRDANAGADTLGIDALLIGVRLRVIIA